MVEINIIHRDKRSQKCLSYVIVNKFIFNVMYKKKILCFLYKMSTLDCIKRKKILIQKV